MLDFMGQCENLLFKPKNREQLKKWIELLEEILNYHGNKEKLMLKTMNKFAYEHKDVLTEKQFLQEAETGDILLFYTEHLSAKIQRFLTNSDFDHVAMVVKLKNKELMIF